MGCKKSTCATLSDTQKQVLESLSQCDEPCGSKDIAARTGMESKKVSCQLTALKKKGFISSPVRCKYEITLEGKNIL
ncbi:MAG: MarR family winged helix-turn-helix transcriptional regulator [Desulfobulbaceae bacterium]|nr:MarR family winged helix-turn-helix transcriptional regulator [Desulfobulbaceae bacterium]